jgi:hypothetical protein
MEALHSPGAAALEASVLAEAELLSAVALLLGDDAVPELPTAPELLVSLAFDGVPQPARAVAAAMVAVSRMSERRCPFLAMAQDLSDPLPESISNAPAALIVSGL